MAAAPTVRTHDLDVPRIGYVHSWANTQNEGWVRAALDTYGVPYTYFADIKLREGNLRQKYDVIVYPHVGGTRAVAGQRHSEDRRMRRCRTRRPPTRPTSARMDQADDIRGGMGWEGLMELVKFVREGGTLITEGATSTIFPEYNISSGVTVESPEGLFVRGSVMRGVFTDRRSPIAYGYDAQVPVYFNQDPVLNVGGGGGFGGAAAATAAIPGVGMNMTPMAQPNNRLSAYDPDAAGRRVAGAPARRGPRPAGRSAADGGGGRGGGGGGRRRRRARRSAARRARIPVESRRHAAVGRAGRRPGARQPRPGRRHPGRPGPRRVVRDPPVLALADPGHVLPRLQRHPELERSRRGQGDDEADDVDAVGLAVRGRAVRDNELARYGTAV